MSRTSTQNLRKLNGQLTHLALEVEAMVNDARKDHFAEQMLRMTGKRAAK
tara:strand:- start:295 stop:444 length:150 start_codon:yes stop_codon:yes gene_type:complete